MSWISYIFPQTILRTSSEYNHDIRVAVENGKKKLLVNGIQQSGPMIEGFWKFAFQSLPMPNNVTSILVLGVGGGTVFHMLHDKYPDATITGVDIDAVIINTATMHFGVSDIATLITQDAKRYIAATHKKYDLVVVDLYIGRDIPEFESSDQFIRDIKRVGTSAIFNYLHDGENGRRSDELRQHLGKVYKTVIVADLPYNRFVYGVS